MSAISLTLLTSLSGTFCTHMTERPATMPISTKAKCRLMGQARRSRAPATKDDPFGIAFAPYVAQRYGGI